MTKLFWLNRVFFSLEAVLRLYQDIHIICPIYISKKIRIDVLYSWKSTARVQLKYEKEDSLHLHRQKRTSWVSRPIGVHIGWPFKTLSKFSVFLAGPFILLLYYSQPESPFDRKYVRAQIDLCTKQKNSEVLVFNFLLLKVERNLKAKSLQNYLSEGDTLFSCIFSS